MQRSLSKRGLLRGGFALAIVGVLVLSLISLPGEGPHSPAETLITGFTVRAAFRPNDPLYSLQWGLPKINAPGAWDAELGSSAVTVAIVDTGVWWTGSDILGNMWSNTDGSHGWDFINNDNNPMDVDPSGTYHGTGVAGVIGAITDNANLVAGVAQVRIMALRALGANGEGSSYNTSAAIRWAADHGARVINLSLGTNTTFSGPTDIQLAVDYAWSKGALIVAAAGNAGASRLDYPAALPNVVAVAAVDQSGRRASFSNYGPGLSLSAPGVQILTLSANNDVHYLSGTSLATPFVSGVAALLLSVNPSLRNVELWNILNETADPVGTRYNPEYGWGIVDALNAINALKRPFISVNAYPTTVSRNSKFSIGWSIRGPVGLPVTNTHVVWGAISGRLGNATPPQSGLTGQNYTAADLSIPSGANTFYFKVVATVNGTTYESREYSVAVSNLPDFLFVLYQLLSSNLLYLALFILALAAIVAFIPQRRARRRPSLRAPTPPAYRFAPPPGPPPGPPPMPPPTQPPTPPASAMEPIRPSMPASQAPPPRPTTPPRPTPPAKKRCPRCGTMVHADNLFCFFCGHAFR